jgi:hypothetical protein
MHYLLNRGVVKGISRPMAAGPSPAMLGLRGMIPDGHVPAGMLALLGTTPTTHQSLPDDHALSHVCSACGCRRPRCSGLGNRLQKPR